jgi:hypothetical protein
MNKKFLSNFVDSSQVFENPLLVSYKKVSYKKKRVGYWAVQIQH